MRPLERLQRINAALAGLAALHEITGQVVTLGDEAMERWQAEVAWRDEFYAMPIAERLTATGLAHSRGESA